MAQRTQKEGITVLVRLLQRSIPKTFLTIDKEEDRKKAERIAELSRDV